MIGTNHISIVGLKPCFVIPFFGPRTGGTTPPSSC
jgi:hypothetical protein